MQQFYETLQAKLPQIAIETAANIRSYLDLPTTPPPTKADPNPDPIRFQRLDHLFVKHQWLSSVHSCRSKLHTGFPSDHYLLVSDVQVRLNSRQHKTAKPPKPNYDAVDEARREIFNATFRKGSTGNPLPPPNPDHSAITHFYTDGSGTRGRCSAVTPAGWGFCVKDDDNWIDACGPVITTPDHSAFLGATVGSNNTGELTAVAEAMLYAIEHQLQRIIIHTDSAWAVNVIKGKWRPKSHKKLVNYRTLPPRFYKNYSTMGQSTQQKRRK